MFLKRPKGGLFDIGREMEIRPAQAAGIFFASDRGFFLWITSRREGRKNSKKMEFGDG